MLHFHNTEDKSLSDKQRKIRKKKSKKKNKTNKPKKNPKKSKQRKFKQAKKSDQQKKIIIHEKTNSATLQLCLALIDMEILFIRLVNVQIFCSAKFFKSDVNSFHSFGPTYRIERREKVFLKRVKEF